MRWYEYKMETDDLCAPEDLKAKLLAMTDQLTEEEKNQPMMKTPAPARPAPVQRKKPVRFPAKRVGTLAACLAVCAVGYGAFATGMIGLGAKSSSPAAYYSADSTAAVMAAGGVDRAAMDSPMAADYSLNSLSLESGADNGTAAYSADDAAAAAHSTDHAKILFLPALHCSGFVFPGNICTRSEILSNCISTDHAIIPACTVLHGNILSSHRSYAL